jgi:hypothetical protein
MARLAENETNPNENAPPNHQICRHISPLEMSSGGLWVFGSGWLINLFIQAGAQLLGHIVNCAQASELQRAHVRDDGPAIFDTDVGPISPHVIAAIRNDVKQFAIGHFDNRLSCRLAIIAIALTREVMPRPSPNVPWQGEQLI